MRDSARRRNETLRQHAKRFEQQFDQACQHEVRLHSIARGLMLEEGANLSDGRLQNLRTLACGSLDAKAVGDALRKFDFTGLPVSQAPSKQFAGVADVAAGVDSDEEVFIELNEQEALVLFGVLSKTWSINRDQKGGYRKDRHPDRLTMTEEACEPRRKSKIPIPRPKAI